MIKFFHLGLVLSRLVVASFVLLTAGYCLLAYIPFTYHQIHLGNLLGWLSGFARFHSLLYWVAFLAAAATLPLKNKEIRYAVLLFLVVYGVTGIVLAFHPLLINLGNSVSSLYWCYLALTPLLWMAALDYLAQCKQLAWAKQPGNGVRRIFRACWCSACFVWVFSSTIALLRYVLLRNIGFTTGDWLWLLGCSLILHLLVFLAIFLLLNFILALSGVISTKPGSQATVFGVAGVFLVAFILKSVVFAPLSFSGSLANVTSIVVAVSFATFFCGATVKLYSPAQGAIQGPLDFFVVPARFVRSASPGAQVFALLLASGLAGYLFVKISVMDWDYLFQKLVTLAIWGIAFAMFYLVIPPPKKSGGNSLVICASLLLCFYMGFMIVQPRWPRLAFAARFTAALDDYAGYDVSFRITYAIASPPGKFAADDSFYAFLAANTNIPRSVATHPVELSLARGVTFPEGRKPHIFMFVIDSLRRDYLSVYNPEVTFTPSIDAFAHESTVFQNAFTRYTGTGLSEPSIWSGAMLLHKQYVTPFYPMNSLQKLLDWAGYRQFVAKDEVLKIIMAPSDSVTELEAGKSTMDLEFCPALADLQAKVDETRSTSTPIFAYIQPQDIHISVINRSGRSKPEGEEYPGFDAPYASRVRKLDTCFGELILYLKNAGLFDNAIIILTADHGDSLGEKGRWGHAYNVVPEVARVPLLMHVPAGLQPPIVDRAEPASLIDITPTIYYLLGRRPIEQNVVFGRPLFTMTQAESLQYGRDSYLIASSYGPVYGVLCENGHALYVADGVQFKDFFYEWGEGASSARTETVTPDMRAQWQKQIRQHIDEISHVFEFGLPQRTAAQ